MGFIRTLVGKVSGSLSAAVNDTVSAAGGAINATIRNQWLDYIMPNPQAATSDTVLTLPGYFVTSNRQSPNVNGKGNPFIISNQSVIGVPEGYALITFSNGEITGVVMEPGDYLFTSDNVNSQSIFAGDNIISALVKASWEKFKFGGTPPLQQQVVYINMKEIPGIRFGTQAPIYWDDAYFGAQVGALTRGSNTIQVEDPVKLVKNYIPLQYLLDGQPFDLEDLGNPASEQLFNEVVASLSAAFARYCNDPSRGHRMGSIQSDQMGVAQELLQVLDENFKWRQDRGLTLKRTAILAIEYDPDTVEMMKDVKRADALSGARGNSFMQQSIARGMQAVGEKGGGGSDFAFMAMGMNAAGQMGQGVQQPNTAPGAYNPFGQGGTPPVAAPQGAPVPGNPPAPSQPTQAPAGQMPMQQAGAQISESTPAAEPAPVEQNPEPAVQEQTSENAAVTEPTTAEQSPEQPVVSETPTTPPPASVAGQPGGFAATTEKLIEMKKLLDAGVITQEEFDRVKSQLLGL